MVSNVQSELVALKKAKIAKYDVLFKCVIEPRHSSLRRMLGIGEAVPLPTDFPGFRSRSVDALYRVGGGVRHVEFQTRDHSTMRWRMLEYFGRIAKREFDLAAGEDPVIEQTVLYVGDGRSGMESEIVTDQLEFAFELRDIEEFEEEWSDKLLASYYPTDIVLGLLCRPVVARRDWTEAMSDEWIRAAERIERMVRVDPFTSGDADALLLVAALLKNVPGVVQEELEMTLRVDVSQSPIMLSVFNRGYNQAAAELTANPILELIERHADANDIPLETDVQEKLTDLDPAALGDVLLGFAAGGDLNDLIAAEVYKRGGPDLER